MSLAGSDALLSRLTIDLLKLFWGRRGSYRQPHRPQFGALARAPRCWRGPCSRGQLVSPSCRTVPGHPAALPPALESQDLAAGDIWSGDPKSGRVEVPGLQDGLRKPSPWRGALFQLVPQSAYLRQAWNAHLILDFDDHSKAECDVGLRVPVLADPASPGDSGPGTGPISLTPSCSYSRCPSSSVPQVPAPSLSTGRAVLSLPAPALHLVTERSGASSTALSRPSCLVLRPSSAIVALFSKIPIRVRTGICLSRRLLDSSDRDLGAQP